MAEHVAQLVEETTTKLGHPFVLGENGVRLHATIAFGTRAFCYSLKRS